MTKEKLFKLSELPGSIDCALPQSFFDEQIRKTGINPLQCCVWHYSPNDLLGKPLFLDDLRLRIVNNVKDKFEKWNWIENKINSCLVYRLGFKDKWINEVFSNLVFSCAVAYLEDSDSFLEFFKDEDKLLLFLVNELYLIRE